MFDFYNFIYFIFYIIVNVFLARTSRDRLGYSEDSKKNPKKVGISYTF